MIKQNKLLKKINNYVKKQKEDAKKLTKDIDIKKIILLNKINAQTKVIKKRKKDIKSIVKVANKLVTLNLPEIDKKLSELAFDGRFIGKLCLSYVFYKKCFNNRLYAEYTDNKRGGLLYNYKVILFDDGDIFFSGALVNKNKIEGLEKRLSILEQIPKMLDELIESLTQIVDNLNSIPIYR